ncbi:hypothetical protein JMJ35_002807 [Cladonia borealis]|uniref:HTH Mu-type domain-containing protein n=1 Tax=Cladonia borealis TaxID=184061 RepID=A0AA39R5I3_9LECA|nr:hypothetical protein JMJ35_002807 [Cladonia borealis]
MPRVTRAALRTQELQEESEIAASTPLPPTPVKKRVPLGEISENVATEAQVAELEQKLVPAKKGSVRGKKANVAKKTNKQRKLKAMNAEPEVLEDDNESSTSSAVEEACQDLLQENSETHQVVLDDEQARSPPSEVFNTTDQQPSPKVTPPQDDIEVQKPGVGPVSVPNIDKDDSFVAKIKSYTPAKMTNGDSLKDESGVDKIEEDLFLEQIKTRSPSKRVSRIEDSVEALDALEEEIEKVDKLIPTTADNLSDTAKTKKQAKVNPKTAEKKSNGSVRIKDNTTVRTRPVTGKPNSSVRSIAQRPSILLATKKAITPPKGSPTKPAIESRSPGPARQSTKVGPQSVTHKRVSSVHKAPFLPTKSAKPPTKSTFELPGEAISRKLKEQREQRLKREEEQTSKPRVFKARPVRLSHAPEVKLTAAARARIGLAKGEHINGSKLAKGTPKLATSPCVMPTASTKENKRVSSLTVAKRVSAVQPTANSSARVTRKISLAMDYYPNASGSLRSAPTAEDLALQKVKGKEVFGRNRAEMMEREKARKEKEDAAKKARAEAAERGRVASREWAEKQKLRKMEALKPTSGTKVTA